MDMIALKITAAAATVTIFPYLDESTEPPKTAAPSARISVGRGSSRFAVTYGQALHPLTNAWGSTEGTQKAQKAQKKSLREPRLCLSCVRWSGPRGSGHTVGHQACTWSRQRPQRRWSQCRQ